jgi:hypothetical protein
VPVESTDKARTERITIRFTQAEKAEIEAMARQENRKAADFARLLILAHIERKRTMPG